MADELQKTKQIVTASQMQNNIEVRRCRVSVLNIFPYFSTYLTLTSVAVVSAGFRLAIISARFILNILYVYSKYDITF